MWGISWRVLVKIVGIIAVLLLPQTFAAVVGAGEDQICRQDSQATPAPFVRIDSATCGAYGEILPARVSDAGDPILIRYMVHRPNPPSKAKAVVVLIAGGQLMTGITGDSVTGQVFTAGQNFLVRSAQLFADAGYTAVTIHRSVKLPGGVPTPEFPDPPSPDAVKWDHYRISPKHAFDIVRVLSQVNTTNLPVFLAGTSRGALSVVPQHMLGSGILLSSPVADLDGPPPGVVLLCPPNQTCGLFVGHPWFSLQPGFVTVPTHVLVHPLDACFVTTPANSLALHNAFVAAGIDSHLDMVTGGFAAPGEDPCEALHFHGFMGVENKAVKTHTKRLDDILKNLDNLFKGNAKPVATPGAAVCPAACVVNLFPLASDPGDILTFSLPHPRSYRADPTLAPNLAIVGSLVTYTPPSAGPLTDGFTYVVSDGKGGISASYVIVTIP